MKAILILLFSHQVFAVSPDDFLNSPNVVFETSSQVKLNEGELPFVCEIPEGSANKYELRTASGQLFLDRILCPRKIHGTNKEIHGYPLSYGITPGRFNVDGDPLDLIVVGSGEFYRAQAKSGGPKPRLVRVVGILRMEECEEPPCKVAQWVQD